MTLILVAGILVLNSGNSFVFAEPTPWEEARAQTFATLGKVEKPSKPMKFGVVLVTLANPYWVSMKNGYESAAKEFGVEMDVQAAPRKTAPLRNSIYSKTWWPRTMMPSSAIPLRRTI